MLRSDGVAAARDVFVPGGTGYLGRPLIDMLAARGLSALTHAVEHPPRGVRILEVPEIRAAA